MINTENRQLLEGIYKSAKTGMDAAQTVLRKADDPSFVPVLEELHDGYRLTAKEAGMRLAKKDTLAEENTKIIKIISWGTIQLNTLSDTTASNIAGVMMGGSSAGIKEAAKLLKNNDGADEEAKCLCRNFISQEQRNIEKLKGFL